MFVHLLQYIFTIHVCLQETAFLQYNESRFIKFDACLNICISSGLKYFIDIIKYLIEWALDNSWRSFMISFMLITIYACINRNSDAWVNITAIYNSIRMNSKEAIVEMWSCLKIAILSISKVLSIVKIMELLVIAFVLMAVPEASKFIMKALEKLGKI